MHDDFEGNDGNQRFYQRAFFTPSGIFKQYKFDLASGQKLSDCVRELSRDLIAPGRYARCTLHRTTRFIQ